MNENDKKTESKLSAVNNPDGKFHESQTANGAIRIEGWLQKGTGGSRDPAETTLQNKLRKDHNAGPGQDAGHGISYDKGGRGEANLGLENSTLNRSHMAAYERFTDDQLKSAKAQNEGLYLVFTGRKSDNGEWVSKEYQLYQGTREKGVRKVSEATFNHAGWDASPPTLKTALGQEKRSSHVGVNSEVNKTQAGGQTPEQWVSPERSDNSTPTH